MENLIRAYLFCETCGEPVAGYHSILDVTPDFISEKMGPHSEVCGRIKLVTKPGNLYFSLREVLRSNSI